MVAEQLCATLGCCCCAANGPHAMRGVMSVVQLTLLVSCLLLGVLLLQETELRTLKAAADDVASKFDAAVAALAAKRLDVLAEVGMAPSMNSMQGVW